MSRRDLLASALGMTTVAFWNIRVRKRTTRRRLAGGLTQVVDCLHWFTAGGHRAKCRIHRRTKSNTSLGGFVSEPGAQMASTPPKTFEFQDSLPPYPVPDLKETCDVYLRSLKPLLTDEEYEHSEAAVLDFCREGARGVPPAYFPCLPSVGRALRVRPCRGGAQAARAKPCSRSSKSGLRNTATGWRSGGCAARTS